VARQIGTVSPGAGRLPGWTEHCHHMNVPLIVIVSLAFPMLWIYALTDKQSYEHAVKLREIIAEILQSIAEWESGELGVIKIQAFKTYALYLENKLGLIRGYLLIRFVAKLPQKKNVRAACVKLPQFYDCIWFGAPECRERAELLAREIEKLLK
jgi:hypothetical protein